MGKMMPEIEYDLIKAERGAFDSRSVESLTI
jgi:hypothetical protein